MNPQANKIYEILKDGEWHCPSSWGYADGHCKRITDINKFLEPLNQKVVSAICNCGKHTSKVVARKIVPITQNPAPSEPITHASYTLAKREFCCTRFWKLGEHEERCFKLKEIQKVTSQQGLF